MAAGSLTRVLIGVGESCVRGGDPAGLVSG